MNVGIFHLYIFHQSAHKISDNLQVDMFNLDI